MKSLFAVKGNIIFTKELGKFEVCEKGYIVVEDDEIVGVFSELDEKYKDIEVIDYGDNLLIPGFVDLHVHAPQYPNIGLGLDKELMPWLETYTFPEEAKYKDLCYAEKVYSRFVHDLWKNGTTRAVVFGTIHKEATKRLMDLFAEAGLGAYVGKVNMDRNSPEFLCEETEQSINDTLEIVKEYGNKYELVKPIITPRFVPSCTPELMEALGKIAKEYQVPVQSHLSENFGEICFVKELHPDAPFYGSIYDKYGLFGDTPTIMAHCVLCSEDEVNLLVEKGVFIAHNPNSNCNLASGIAPIRRLLSRGIPIGLGSDVSGGHTLSMANACVIASQVSNIKWIQSDRIDKPLSTADSFYLATKGGGAFFGKVGSFEPGYKFDCLVIDDSCLPHFKPLTILERLQKFLYTGDDRNIKARYINGILVTEPKIIV